ncbi:MAG: hypothetical protein HDQ92_07720 [Desulfovibrio sp.]|nr:hypothetical protein [Desulfovibrio sp.]
MPDDNSSSSTAPTPEDPKKSPKGGNWNIPADELEEVPTKTSVWQWAVIIVAGLILIAIGLTFRGAEERENAAATQQLSTPLVNLVQQQTAALGLSEPKVALNIATKAADVFVDFPAAIGGEKARDLALAVCAGLARAYVEKGYMPRDLAVHVGTVLSDGARATYGTALFNGNLDQLGWEPVSAQ